MRRCLRQQWERILCTWVKAGSLSDARVPEGRRDDTAIGRDGQFVHIYPRERVVIVQISDWKAWTSGDFLECETFKVQDVLAAAASWKQINMKKSRPRWYLLDDQSIR